MKAKLDRFPRASTTAKSIMNMFLLAIPRILRSLSVVTAISLAGIALAAEADPALPSFEFHRTAAKSPEDAAKTLFVACAKRSISDFVQHIQLGSCDGPVGTIQKFAECLHSTKFKHGEESYCVYDLPLGELGGLKVETIRILASAAFPSTEKVKTMIINESLSSYYGEKFQVVDVAADGSDGRVYQTRIVIAGTKEGWFAVPRCRSAKPFYEIADEMPATKPADAGDLKFPKAKNPPKK